MSDRKKIMYRDVDDGYYSIKEFTKEYIPFNHTSFVKMKKLLSIYDEPLAPLYTLRKLEVNINQ